MGWGDNRVHPLFEGKTPLQLEEMSLGDLTVHAQRAEAYVAKVKDEVLIHAMIKNHEEGRRDLLDPAPLATDRYRRLWHVARKRLGLDA